MPTSPTANIPRKSVFRTIILTWLLVGFLDASGATINYLVKGGKHPEKIFNFIASGIFGKEALTGNGMALLGLLFHFLIAFIWTLFFFLIYPKIKLMAKNWIITGLVYGLVIWLIMTRIVLPLSNTPKIPFNITQAIVGALILMLAIGLPASFIASRFYSRQNSINKSTAI